MSSVIVDVQGFKLKENNKFICKELAIINLENGLCTTKMFKPPYSWHNLSRENKETARWLTKNLHSLEWCSGDVSYSDFPSTLENLLACDEVGKIYVKGLEKVSWLQQYLHEKIIINLEDLDCPKLSEIHDPFKIYYCNLHINNCAVRNVNSLLKWFKRKFTTFNAFQAFHNAGGLLSFIHEEEIAQLPMEFIMVYAAKQINSQWSRFPKSWTNDKLFQQYLCCHSHFNQWGSNEDVVGCYIPMKRDCLKCNTSEIDNSF